MDPNSISTTSNGCCNGLVSVPVNDPQFLPDIFDICIDPRPDLALTKTLTSTQTDFTS
jgi:hypothetical protein